MEFILYQSPAGILQRTHTDTYSFICFAGSVFLVEDKIIPGTISGTTVGSQVNIAVFEISIFLFQGR
jgi:hypothetical protein